MLALITGASSGIGRDFSRQLSQMGYDIIAVAQDEGKLKLLKEELTTNVQIITCDLSIRGNVLDLYEKVKGQDIDIVINNAGFGVFGEFDKTDLTKELNMIDVNISAVHILTKLFLQDFKKKNKGYILNVASSAAFEPGPLMASYYATKAYVLRLTQAIHEELRRTKSNVYVGALCPGPVETNFNNVAGVKFSIKALKSQDVARYAINKMFKKKTVIVPGFIMKCTRIATKILPDKFITRIAYNIQKSKEK